MTTSKKPPPRVKGSSGEHEAVKSFRAKLASIADGELEDLKAFNRTLDEALVKARSDPPISLDEADLEPEETTPEPTTPKVRDPRREPHADPRSDPSIPPVDYVPRVPRPDPKRKP